MQRRPARCEYGTISSFRDDWVGAVLLCSCAEKWPENWGVRHMNFAKTHMIASVRDCVGCEFKKVRNN